MRSHLAEPTGQTRLGLHLATHLAPGAGQSIVGRIDLNPVDPPRYAIGYWLDAGHCGAA